MRRLAALLLVSLACCTLWGCGRRLAPEQAREVLRTVQQARQSATVQGSLQTSVRVRDQLVTAEASIQRAPGIVHLQYHSGRFAGWKIIEQDGMVWRVGPDGKPQTWEHGVEPGGGGLPLRPNLAVRHAGGGRIAGRPVDRYVIQAPDGGRSRAEVAIDRETHYPLRLSRYGSRGHLTSQSVYTAVKYDAAPPKALPVPEVATRSAQRERSRVRGLTEAQLIKLFGLPLLKPTYLPPGFQTRGMFSHETRRGTMAEIRHSDGLRNLSVLQVKLPNAQQRQQWQQRQGRVPQDGERWQQKRPQRPQGQAQEARRELWKRGEERRPEAGQAGGREGGVGQGLLRSRLRGHLVRERRGDRMVIVTGDIAPEQLQQVMNSIPFPAGERPVTRF